MTPNEKIKVLVDKFQISPKEQAKAMGISRGAVYNRANPNVPGENFKEQNYTDLLDYVDSKLSELRRVLTEIKR